MFTGFLTAQGFEIAFFMLNMVLFVSGLYFLYRLQQKRVSFNARVLIGLGLGIALGLFLQLAFGASPG